MGKKLRSRGLNCPLNVLCIVFTLENYRKYARFLKRRSTKFGICQIRFRSTSWTSQIHQAAKVISKRVTPLVHRAWKRRSYRNVTVTICWEPVFLAVWNVGTLKFPNLLQFAKDTCDDFGNRLQFDEHKTGRTGKTLISILLAMGEWRSHLLSISADSCLSEIPLSPRTPTIAGLAATNTMEGRLMLNTSSDLCKQVVFQICQLVSNFAEFEAAKTEALTYGDTSRGRSGPDVPDDSLEDGNEKSTIKHLHSIFLRCGPIPLLC